MSHRAETEFGTLVGELLADLERFRPGLPEAASLAELQAALGARARLRLGELYREYQVDERGEDPEAAAQLQLYQREVEQILLPRYASLCRRQNALERDRSTAWRGADLYNRLTYAAIFFAIGNFNRLSADDRCHLTAESLRKAYWYGGFNLEERKAVVYLLENLERFGKVLSKTRETAYVGGSGWAMPVSFDKTVYGYSTDELLKAMRELADEAKLDPAAYLKQG